MARDAKYGLVLVEKTPGNPLGDDEPVFLLRARDVTSVDVLKEYQRQSVLLSADPTHVRSLDNVISNFKAWQDENPELVKVPD